MKKPLALLFAILLAFTFAACSPSAPDTSGSPANTSAATSAPTNDPQSGEELSVALKGLADTDIVLTIADVKTLTPVTQEVTSVNSSGTEKKMTVTGATLADILEHNGYALADYSTITTRSADDYTIDIPREILQDRDILLVYDVDGEVCNLRTVIPEERAMYWGKDLVEISFNVADSDAYDSVSQEVSKLVSLNTAVDALDKVPFEYNGATDEAIAIEGFIPEVSVVELRAADGLEKTMEWADFALGFIKITGDAAPYFGSPDMPRGMTVKNLAVIKAGADVYFDLNGVLALIGDDATFADVCDALGLKPGEAYVLTGSDDYSVEIPTADADKGTLTLQDDGTLKVSFEGLAKNTTVKGLQTIQTK